ncbi:hypothetical protein [Tsukamurella paurometabola]|uniref:Uncharacterized protein n=1 Tax=Tsukamurella paurometabola TaxID=2061 RepID=A0ABS5NFH1_TSUPA|nr:hypothetical protein [Tsukamurella paurometabola]MBS4102775.1 hypothetical protein [Tsukamurella paurometabola]
MSDGWPEALIERAEELEHEAARLRRAAGEARNAEMLLAALALVAEARSRGEISYPAMTVDQVLREGLAELEDWEALLVVERLLGEPYGSSGDLWIQWSERGAADA